MISIALDGPAGAGKSTLADELAKRLSYIHVDTGALYRAVGLFMLRSGIAPDNAEQVEKRLPDVHISLKFTENGQRIYLDGEDVSEAIRTPEASSASSMVSAIPAVRAFLLETQRKLARENNVIMDGRDIGTVVLPDADVKIFLTARPEARAKRRFRELQMKGLDVDFDTVLKDVIARDERDMNRASAPLKQADDAVLADTSDLNFEQSLDLLEKLVLNKIGG